jgi:hypothetical protein
VPRLRGREGRGIYLLPVPSSLTIRPLHFPPNSDQTLFHSGYFGKRKHLLAVWSRKYSNSSAPPSWNGVVCVHEMTRDPDWAFDPCLGMVTDGKMFFNPKHGVSSLAYQRAFERSCFDLLRSTSLSQPIYWLMHLYKIRSAERSLSVAAIGVPPCPVTSILS